MAQQQIQIAETIRAMKLAMKRHAREGDSDSDGQLRTHTNRGNKLKRSARHLQQHRLDDTGGLSYRKKAKHAGYLRSTIASNPPLLDEDGDLYSPVSSDDEAARLAEPAADNPFGHVRLETLLRPLTSPADLPDHPSLSIPYKSTALPQMASEALEMLRRERASLWKAKRLLQRFRGDADWVPCSTFETENDELLFNGEESVGDQSAVPSLALDHPALALMPPVETIGIDAGGDTLSKAVNDGAAIGEMEGVETLDMALAADKPVQDSDIPPVEPSINDQDAVVTNAPVEPGLPTDTITANEDPTHAPNPILADLAADQDASSETASNSNTTERHAMTTRARARSPADRTPSPSPSDSASIPPIHPWFLAPTSSLPDRDLALPPTEAEDTRKLLLLYVQKQEQVVRSLTALHSGLQKADRLRGYVYQTCKAEAHLVPDGKGNLVTEMSDGEDWYDVNEWNLQARELKDGKLEKGKEEVEEVEEEGRRRPGRGRRVNRI